MIQGSYSANVSVNQQSSSEALKAGLVDAALGTAAGFAAQKIGGLRQDGRINNASHKVLHAVVGAAGGRCAGGL